MANVIREQGRHALWLPLHEIEVREPHEDLALSIVHTHQEQRRTARRDEEPPVPPNLFETSYSDGSANLEAALLAPSRARCHGLEGARSG